MLAAGTVKSLSAVTNAALSSASRESAICQIRRRFMPPCSEGSFLISSANPAIVVPFGVPLNVSVYFLTDSVHFFMNCP